MAKLIKYSYLVAVFWMLALNTYVHSESSLTAHYSVVEGIREHTIIGDVISDSGLGTSVDSNTIRLLRFAILKGERDQFTVDRQTGYIRANSTLDRDVVCPGKEKCQISLDVAVVQPVDHFQIIQITIDILDLNDNAPTFPEKVHQIRVSESTNPGVKFVIPAAQDPDSVSNGIQSYRLDTNTSAFSLNVNAERGGMVDLELILMESLDREQRPTYQMYVIATDGGQPPSSGSMQIVINVIDANDNPPTFIPDHYDVTVREDVGLDTVLLTVHAEDADVGVNSHVLYTFVDHPECLIGPERDPDGRCQFAINTNSGDIVLKEALDFEKEANYLLLVRAMDQGPDGVPTFAKVTLRVLDVNDMAPVISVSGLVRDDPEDDDIGSGYAEVDENQPSGSFVAYVSVEDKDGGDSGVVKCMINHETTFTMTKVYDNQYKIVTNLRLDREMTSQYDVRIFCQDDGDPILSSEYLLLVIVKDVNDNSPVFTRTVYTTELIENNSLNATLLRVRARDADIGPNADVTYYVHSSYRSVFRIGEQSGLVRPNVVFDREQLQLVEARILAVDRGTPSRTGTATIRVAIGDANDCAPQFRNQLYTFGTYENQPHGTVIGTVQAVDKDTEPFAKFTFSLQNFDVSSYLPFVIDRYTGQITTTRVLDREQQATYYLLATATDTNDPELRSTTNVTVYVADKNDNPPVITFPGSAGDSVVLHRIPDGSTIVTKVVASDLDLGENARIRYTIIHGNDWHLWRIDENTGAVLYVGGTAPLPTREHLLVVVAKDCGDPELSNTAKLTIIFNITNEEAALNNHLPGMADIAPQEATNPGGIGPELQFRIILILAVITTFIVLVLVTIIIILRRRQLNEKRRTNNKTLGTHTVVPDQDQTYLFVNNNQDSVSPSGFIKGVCNNDDPDTLLQIAPGVDGTSVLDIDLSSSGISMGSEGITEVGNKL